MSPRPSGACPVCGRVIAGRMPVEGKLVLRAHNRFNKGTRESGWGPAVPCPGSGKAADLLQEIPGQPEIS